MGVHGLQVRVWDVSDVRAGRELAVLDGARQVLLDIAVITVAACSVPFTCMHHVLSTSCGGDIADEHPDHTALPQAL